jgi:uncharacterized phiE125 gp8 family phage protein
MSHTATGYGISEVTAPTAEPLQVSEARRHLALDDSYYDDYISSLVEVTRATVQAHTHRQLVTATFDAKLDALPAGQGTLCLPYGQLQSITSVSYTDTAGVSQTFSSGDYDVSIAREPGTIRPAYGEVWPVARLEQEAATVRFVCGYGAASAVPQAIKQAMLLLIGHYFNNREQTIVGTMASEIPQGSQALLAPFVLGDSFTWYGQAN